MELDSTDNPGRFFFALSRDLKSIALSNVQYFQNGKQSHHAKFHVTFRLLYEYLDVGIEPSYRELAKYVSEYDFSSDVKGNGYRSLLRVVQKCCLHLLQLSRYISSVRDSMLFRKKVYAKELESYVSALGQLRAVLYYALKLTQYCQQGHLFADEDHLNSDIAEALMLEVESLSQESFYGRCLGFQYCESMQRPLQAIGIVMASYSEGYLESSHMMRVATSVFNSGKYFLDPELRAKQMVKVTRTADIRFCQTFWNFPESPIMHQLPSFVCPVMEVNETLTLGPDAFELLLADGGDTVVITPPCAHTGPGHVYTRLISAHLREGQSVKNKSPTSSKPRVPGLIVHFHGGGFVAQSSKSHEVYLRDWAVSTGCPILSVDYSLAPQAPFPRALEECFYAYAWAVQNCEQLGLAEQTYIQILLLEGLTILEAAVHRSNLTSAIMFRNTLVS
ncbi:hormone-sensitive lipase [Plakobranchus ocellatus]|uniref:Hormone-sensitive lipase n=1 Tax=Plakobranchus ocellatus TaxID=259542 RepID=A0AAV3YUA0_9GAST|nr:hormone-sensitive lipase [Plakobranchus ocellatus]